MREMTRVFDLTYPKLKIDFVHVCGSSFDTALVHWLAEELRVNPNMMFIRQPGTKHIHQNENALIKYRSDQRRSRCVLFKIVRFQASVSLTRR
ncbi:hypothetical protein PC116_g2787 [Phytophthora cactorum]|nr:hypothetical protein PC116_g2787 [Phytophthora cactorum]